MSRRAVNHFLDEVACVIDRFKSEYKMTYAEMVGSLTMLAQSLTMEAANVVCEDDETQCDDENDDKG